MPLASAGLRDTLPAVAQPARKPMIGLLIAVVSVIAVWLTVAIANQFTRTVAGGVTDGMLAPCPPTPNGVGSTDVDPTHAIAPLRVDAANAEAFRAKVRSAVARMPRFKVVRDDGDYLHIEARTAFFRFVDDVELVLQPAQGLVQVRSVSRLGVSDLGANRRRIEALRAELARP
jgi:uncharacterized protein (DUF1499 family)